MSSSSWILHLDFDAFFASVEQLRNPKLQGKPVAVGSGVVASCSYEARKYGVKAGMPLSRAKKLCPQLVILPGRASVYRAFAEEVFQICQEFSPQIQTYLDEVDCDMTGTEVLYGSVVKAARKLVRRITERTALPVSVGIGTNRMIAKLAGKASKPKGIGLVPPGDEEKFLEELPVELLPGIGPKAARTLNLLNVKKIGELRKFSRESLQALFGIVGLAIYERCRGKETDPVVISEIPKTLSRRTSFSPPETNPATLEGLIEYLTERLGSALRKQDLKAKRLTLKIEYPDGLTDTAVEVLSPPSYLDNELFLAAQKAFHRAWMRRVGIQRFVITLSALVPCGKFLQLEFQKVDKSHKNSYMVFEAERLMRAKDCIRNRWGFGSILTARALLLRSTLKEDPQGFLLRTSCLTS